MALDVKKNRYDGYLGRILLQFNEVNQSFSQVSQVYPYHRSGYAFSNADGKPVHESTMLSRKVATPAKQLWEQAMLKREQSMAQSADITEETSVTSVDSTEKGTSDSDQHINASTSISVNQVTEIAPVQEIVAPKKRSRKTKKSEEK